MKPEDTRSLKEGMLLRVIKEPPYPGQIHGIKGRTRTQAISYYLSGNSHLISFGEYVLYLRPTIKRHKRNAQWVVVLHNESIVAIDPKYLERAEP